MIRSDLHTHTTLCDGANTPREMVEAALARGMELIGFSAHSVTPFDRSYCLRDEAGYVREVLALRREYAGRIRVLCGLELDAYGTAGFQPDYVIGSVHYLRRGERYFPVDLSKESLTQTIAQIFDGDPLRAADAYYRTLREMVHRTAPTVIGHFDLLTKFEGIIDENAPEYQRIVSDTLDAVLPVCRLFELNTGTMSRGYRTTPYPAPWILHELRKRGAAVILSSDAHRAEALEYGFEQSLSLLRACGFREITVMKAPGLTTLCI
ncbi:MAG: histidinol-phosphatase [Eubacteriales bacterium]